MLMPTTGRTRKGYFFTLRSGVLSIRVPGHPGLALERLSSDKLPGALDDTCFEFRNALMPYYASYTLVTLQDVQCIDIGAL